MSEPAAIFLIVVILILAVGALLTLVGHLMFLRSLRVAHPDLWRTYREITFTADHTTYKHYQLSSRVYPHITDPRVIRARRADLVFRRIFAVSSLISALAFAAWRLIPAFRQ
jgi:hypothetical protein